MWKTYVFFLPTHTIQFLTRQAAAILWSVCRSVGCFLHGRKNEEPIFSVFFSFFNLPQFSIFFVWWTRLLIGCCCYCGILNYLEIFCYICTIIYTKRIEILFYRFEEKFLRRENTHKMLLFWVASPLPSLPVRLGILWWGFSRSLYLSSLLSHFCCLSLSPFEIPLLSTFWNCLFIQ